jgi:hypothetical protein
MRLSFLNAMDKKMTAILFAIVFLGGIGLLSFGFMFHSFTGRVKAGGGAYKLRPPRATTSSTAMVSFTTKGSP